MSILLKTAVVFVLGVSTPAKTSHDFRWVAAELDSAILVDATSISIADGMRGFDVYMAVDRKPVAYGRGHFEADCAAQRIRITSHGKLNAGGDGFDDSPEANPRWANRAREAAELRMINLVCAAPAARDRYAATIAGDWRQALDAALAKAQRGLTPSP
jgi:hypothetical protein